MTGSTAGARAPLSRERAVMVAVGLADAGGIASLTMRKLAAELGVEAMSLYHHVANKDDILDAMVDFVFSEIELPSLTAPWRAAMRARAFSAREVLLAHPWAIGLMDSRATPGQATLRHHDAVLGCLRTSGFEIAMAAHAISLLDSYVHGFVLQEISLPFDASSSLDAEATEMLAQMDTAAFPYLMEIATEHVLQPGYSYADEFPFGLELILDGLERLAR
ncbi:Transcriptional regulator, TetR family [metagenome]|uniref:Transcriptional regulator, TetR family n=1 Tax=metagenome TaxID=256318 RepID=A0A2P2BZP3_9ZZZZ